MNTMRLYYAPLLILAVSSVMTIADEMQQKCNVHPREVDLLKSLIKETDYLNSMNFIDGPNKNSPAVVLNGSRGVCVDNMTLTFQKQLHEYSCSRNELVLRACVKFDGVADGPIMFLHSGNVTYLSLEVESSVQGGSIKVSFTYNGEMRAIQFPYDFTDPASWHHITVVFNGRLVSLFVNCNKIGEQIIMKPEYCLPENLLLNIGDNPLHTETFKGCLQDLVISFKERSIAKQCPKAHTDCRFSAAYEKISTTANTLMEEHNALLEEVKVLKQNLSMYKSMSAQFPCYVDGKQYEYGTFFKKDDSTICFCSQGGTEKCTQLDDDDDDDDEKPSPPPTKKCKVGGKEIKVGHFHYKLDNNGATCSSQECKLTVLSDSVSLAWLAPAKKYQCDANLKNNCSSAQQWTTVQREAAMCCGFCSACEMQNECGKNTKCVEDGPKYDCVCKDGFILEGGECVDIDECKHGRRPVVGHYCPTDAECKNTEGSFTCHCPENYTFIDRKGHASECKDNDECKDPNACPADFICMNTEGSYKCECPDGYKKAGNQCIAECNPPCRPGGKCIDPNVCSCPKGLHGDQCEKDDDECAHDNTHDCSPNATCINFHGGYFCRCNDGYRGSGRVCEDIDECAEKTHTCPQYSTCENLDGTFKCDCPAGDCKDGCVNRKTAYPNGGTRTRQNQCTTCTCNFGKWSCTDVECDCSLPTTSPCCSHCNKLGCKHAEQDYDHSEEFVNPLNPCEICECRHGKVSCKDKRSNFTCPAELLDKSLDGCDVCKVDKCTTELEGTEVDANNSCAVCTCKNEEWSCRPKVTTCEEVTCESEPITVACCQVCEGTEDKPHPTVPDSLLGTTSNEGDDC